MEVQLNTLYVMTQGAYLHRDHQTVQVEIEKKTCFEAPIHHLESVALFGNILVSPAVLELCAEAGVAVSFLSERGRLLARVDAPHSGNVLLRREQYRWADDAARSVRIARSCVAGKLQNARVQLLRSARETPVEQDSTALQAAVDAIGRDVEALPSAQEVNGVRGLEGDGARRYFAVLSLMLKQQRHDFAISGRTRRPPLDRTNAMLSFAYALLLHDCVSALAAVGLDPSVGYLHEDRPGRPSLALDLMEEFRTLVADRLVLTLINRKQVTGSDFKQRPGGAVELSEAARRTLVRQYQERKHSTVAHPVLGEMQRVGRLPFTQAKLLARVIRGDLQDYPACVLK